MIKNCHNYQIDINTFIKNNKNYVICFVRQKEIILRPEEEVRQALLIYFNCYTSIFDNFYDVKVEHKNLDIVVYHRFSNQNFNPAIAPIIIIELKKDRTNLEQHQLQILQYLKTELCENGLIFNCKSIFHFSKKNDFKKEKIKIEEIEGLIDKSDNSIKNDEIAFKNATNGDVECFILLAKNYSRTNNIEFRCIDYTAPIKAFWFDFFEDYIIFSICGFDMKIKIKKENFIKLIAIKSSC